MKSIHDFVFCDGTFSPQTIWFLVLSGTSARDRAALRRLQRLASSSPHMLLAPHSGAMCELRQRIAEQTFPTMERPAAMMRTKYVTVAWLLSFMNRYPWQLLNSSRIDTPISVPAMTISGWRTPAEIQLSRYCLTRRSSKNLSRHD